MNALNAAIYTTLSGGTALVSALGGTAIYHLQAPDAADLPYVVFSWAGGGHVNETPGDRIEEVEFIRVYHTNAYQAGVIDGLIKARMHNQAISVTGYSTMLCQREDDFESVEQLPSGGQVYAMGGYYRIVIT